MQGIQLGAVVGVRLVGDHQVLAFVVDMAMLEHALDDELAQVGHHGFLGKTALPAQLFHTAEFPGPQHVPVDAEALEQPDLLHADTQHRAAAGSERGKEDECRDTGGIQACDEEGNGNQGADTVGAQDEAADNGQNPGDDLFLLIVAETGAYDGLLANLLLERLFLLTAHLTLALEGRRARSRLPVGLFLGDLGRLRSLAQALPDRLGGRSYRLPDDILQVAVVLPIDCLLNSIANLIADILRSSHGTSQRIETHVFPKLF